MTQASDRVPEQLLTEEFALWKAADRQVRLFLRDDDAISDTPALRKLSELCEQNSAPLLLAAIPKFADNSLAELVKRSPLLTPAVHGFAHVNHSPLGQKTCELDRFRPLEVVIREMKTARKKLHDLFDGNVSALLVPPWNRIHDEILPHVIPLGFGGISAHGWKKPQTLIPAVNVHLDIMHWSGGTV
ncbi:MAG: polysaccharide deacetylase family protein, partial [Rhizobiaceae bacterium]